MELQILKSNKNIDFSNQTITEQMDKIIEECDELGNEVYGGQGYYGKSSDVYKRIASESLDVIQAAMQMLYIMQRLRFINIEDVVKDHNAKLDSRGWEYDGVLVIEKVE